MANRPHERDFVLAAIIPLRIENHPEGADLRARPVLHHYQGRQEGRSLREGQSAAKANLPSCHFALVRVHDQPVGANQCVRQLPYQIHVDELSEVTNTGRYMGRSQNADDQIVGTGLSA